MLPSFRLIAATFLCGFFVVFAGLRMAASLNDIHEGLPVMAAHAAPVSITPVADRSMRRGSAAVPVMYDLRFAVGTANAAPMLASVTLPTFDHPAPPLAIVPSEDIAKETSANSAADTGLAAEPTKAEPAVAVIRPDAPLGEVSASAPPELAETAAASDTATIEPQAPPALLGAEEPLIYPDPDTSSPLPAAAIPTTEAQAQTSTPLPKPKVGPKKRVRTARRVEPANAPADPTSPFGTLPGNTHP
jgi:hypothetical protein